MSQQVVFDRTASLATPVVLTSITCLDWVGYLGQFQAVGIGGLSSSFNAQKEYPYQSRARALNNVVDPTNGAQIIAFDATTQPSVIGDTDLIGTIADHLDLAAATQNLYWFSQNVLPTNKTNGRNSLVKIQPLSTAPSSGKTFTDEIGSAGQLHYVELSQESSSQNVANTIVINNFSLVQLSDPEVTQIGGANLPKYGIVNGQEVIAVNYESSWQASDSTSITTYGNRATEVSSNLAGIFSELNLISNPSLEYDDKGWSTSTGRMARRKPLEISSPFAAFDGEWSLRMRLSATGSATPDFRYAGSEADGVPVVPGTTYNFQGRAYRGTPNRTDVRARAFIIWQNDSGGTISTLNGTQNTIVSAWTGVGVTGVAPANAERAIVGIEWSRTGGGNFSVGDIFWCDAFVMRKSATTVILPYFDGDTPSTTAVQHFWTGAVGQSQSIKVSNKLDDLANTYLARYSTTSKRVTRIRWNAQEDLTAVSTLQVGSTISVRFDGTTTTHRIVGVDGNIAAERYMIDYYLEKV